MAKDLVASTIVGALFGSALTASGVYQPSIILSQMKLTNFHMLEVFLTASSASALTVALYERLRGQRLNRRPPSNLGYLGLYDGNIVGGAMVGAGMVMTGACPGTVLVQVATGVRCSRYTLLGGIIGGYFYALFGEKLRRKSGEPIHSVTTTQHQSQDDHSLPGKMGLDPHTALLVFDGMCVGLILLTRKIFPPAAFLRDVFVNPIISGLIIGTIQFLKLFMTGSPVGVSSCYEDFGKWIHYCQHSCMGAPTSERRLSTVKRFIMTSPIAFAVGMLAGSLLLSRAFPIMGVSSLIASGEKLEITPMRGILGGSVMVFGARLAGGCTSGHGISGMSMLGISSLITVGAMFVAGIVLAQIS